MKFIMDERVEHWLIGLVVILSIIAIFAPTLMKKPISRFDKKVNVAVLIPNKPISPKVNIPEKQQMFSAVTVDLPKNNHIPEKPVLLVAKAEQLGKARVEKVLQSAVLTTTDALTSQLQKIPNAASTTALMKTNTVVIAAKQEIREFPSKSPVLAKNTRLSKDLTFAVQLAIFSHLDNATSLIKRLHEKGYAASYDIVRIGKNKLYKVLVSKGVKKEQAQDLQKQLASMQMHGFVVVNNRLG